MKRPGRMESASALIDERINELGDWRGKMLAKVRELIHEADPESSKDGSGGGLPYGPTAASSVRERRTRTSSR
jgi:hypothetical protein